MVGTLFYSQLLSACVLSHLLALFIAWRFVDFHIKVGCCKVGRQKKRASVDRQKRFMSPSVGLCCSSAISLWSFVKEGWWRIDALVNINTALASVTKPSAINTEEWLQPEQGSEGVTAITPRPSSILLHGPLSHFFKLFTMTFFTYSCQQTQD